VIVRSVDAPAGGSIAGAERCDPDGTSCKPIEAGAELTGAYALHTVASARLWLDLGGGVSLEMAGQAAAVFTGGEHPTVSLTRGAFALDAPAAAAAPFQLVATGRPLAVDPAMPASITVRARDDARADLVVRRGRVTVGDGAAAIDLRSGEGARLRADRPVERGLATAADPVLDAPREARPAERAVPRGLGTMTARAPGTTEVVAGVRLVSHRVNVVLRDGFARTEIEEEFANDTARVLEGRYVFPVPPDASLSRLALWVGKELVEGEVVERDRAATIFKSIVEDSVRPRDPALLEWVSGSEVSLKIFPMPPHGSRKVVLAYDQALAAPDGRARYVYPLSLGADRAVTIDDFALRVAVSDAAGAVSEAETPGYAASVAADRGGLGVTFHARAFTPAADFVLAYDRPERPSTPPGGFVTASLPIKAEEPGERFVAVRVPVTWPAGASPPARVRRDRAVVIDVSHSQSKETLAGEIEVAEGVLGSLDPDERFVLLACDSACAAYPEDGLAPAAEASLEPARAWLRARAPGGSSDVAGAILAAARRLDPGGAGQIVMLGDGAATSGELHADTIAARVRPELAARQIDLRLLGAGRTVDAVVLDGLAAALGASYERLDAGEPLARRVPELALSLRAPLLRGAALTTPPGLHDVYPRVLPSLRVGSELVVVGRLDAGATGEVRLAGDLGGVAFAAARPIDAEAPSPVVPRLWASARIAELEASAEPAATKEIVALSKQHHVLSRRTALLVLENDHMFAEFGIPRTQGKAGGAGSEALGLGTIGTLGAGASAPAGLIGAGSKLADEPSAVGHMWGDGIGDSFGAGGLGLSGMGNGGGGQGFGSGHGRLGGSHRSGAPQVRMGAVNVSGRLPPEVIQRIVRQNFGRYRLCYENGLRSNPDLRGRVSVRFVIDREGRVSNVANGGSDLPDASVVSCVVRGFSGLMFPQPEGGVVSVTYPIVFAPEGAAPSVSRSFPADGPTAQHLLGDDRWMTQGDDALDKLRRAVEEQSGSRQRHEALIRGLILRGRFADALVAARRFAELDPDLGKAGELYAAAAAAAGEPALARTALDGEVELAADSVELHTRAARAFEAAGDEPRACAHWRSLAELRPRADDLRYQAWRCRARLGDREAVLGETAALERPGKPLTALLASLRAGAVPAYDLASASPGEMEATVRCADGSPRCPDVVVVKPSGDVVSPWTPSARVSAHSAALASVPDGTYRTLLVGGAPDARGEVTLRAFSGSRTFRFERGGLQTVASTTVTRPSWGFR
jgi:Ca-activated chloride channel family protein